MYCIFDLKKAAAGVLVVAFCALLCRSGNRLAETFKVGGREIPIYSVERDDNKIALTFDCAWDDNDVDRIIETLKRYNAEATFFAVGTWAEKYPEALKKISLAGFEVGNHSYNHAHYSTMSREEILADINKGDAVIESITSKPVKLFRAAYGEYNDDVVSVCEESGRKYIQWSNDSLDYKAKSAEEIFSRVTAKVAAGDIILLHNGTEFTAEALERLIPELEKNFELVSVSDLIYDEEYIIDHAGRQFSLKKDKTAKYQKE